MKNYRLYDAEMFYKEGLIPSKDNAGYQEYLGEMHTKFPELNAMGIYGIRYNGRIAYVGKSTDICNRWIAHMWNATSKNSKEYNRSMYIFLRHMLQLGNVQFEVLETTTDKEKLSYLEAYYINSLMPMLNKKVPKLKDRFYKIDKEHSVWDINPGSMENCVQIACDFDNNRMNKEKLIYLKAYYFNIYGGSEYKWDVRLRDTEKKLYRSDVMRVMPKITAKEYADILDDLTNNRTAKVAC